MAASSVPTSGTGPAAITVHLVGGPTAVFEIGGVRLLTDPTFDPPGDISGDNASLAIVRDVADHAGPIDIAVLFAGRARSPLMDAYLTFSADQAAEILGSPVVIPMHVDGWKHLTEDVRAVQGAFARRGLIDRLLVLTPGVATTVSASAQA